MDAIVLFFEEGRGDCIGVPYALELQFRAP